MTKLDAALACALVPVLLACGLIHPYTRGGLTAAGDVDALAIREGLCVDVGVALQGRGDVSPLILVTRFGNHCEQAARLDFGRITIEAHYPETTKALHMLDPRGEIVPLNLQTQTSGVEKIILGPTDVHAPERICVRVSDAIDGVSDRRPICFARSDLGQSAGQWGVLP